MSAATASPLLSAARNLPGGAPTPGLKSDLSVIVLGEFALLRRGEPVEVPSSTRQLVALLALDRRSVSRSRLADALWRDKGEERGRANLRTVLWRIRQCCPNLVATTGPGLCLEPHVEVDLDGLTAVARALEDGTIGDPREIDPEALCQELLPDWCDEFVQLHREIVLQQNLHALENLARHLLRGHHWGRALQVALAAVNLSPLRQTSHQLVIEIHLDEGNLCEAQRQFETLADLLWQELRVHPSEALRGALRRRGVPG